MDTANFAIAMGAIEDLLVDAIPVAGMLFTLAVLWLILRHRERNRRRAGLSAPDAAILEQIGQTALRLEQRVAALERATETESGPAHSYRKAG